MPRTIPSVDAHQEQLLARADASADAAEAAVRAVWLELLRVIREGGPWAHVAIRAAAVLRALPVAARVVAEDLAALHRDAATWTAEKLAATLPQRHRERLLTRVLPGGIYPRSIPLLEDTVSEANLLAGMLLPPLDAQAVQQVVYASGWHQTIQKLTTLAAPDTLAARIAALVSQGMSVQKVAREIRPAVQEVQASARRVARTAGLWVAHEAEREVYRGLEGDLILGYTIRAVLDSRTRPEHRARDGRQFWCRPGPGQKGMNECPHPPREADGSWAFNCRCWLEAILDVW